MLESWITEYWIWLVVAASIVATVLAVMVIMAGFTRFRFVTQAARPAGLGEAVAHGGSTVEVARGNPELSHRPVLPAVTPGR